MIETPLEKLIRQARELKNIYSYNGLAEMIEVNKGTVWRLFNNLGTPTIATLLLLEAKGLISVDRD